MTTLPPKVDQFVTWLGRAETLVNETMAKENNDHRIDFFGSSPAAAARLTTLFKEGVSAETLAESILTTLRLMS